MGKTICSPTVAAASSSEQSYEDQDFPVVEVGRVQVEEPELEPETPLTETRNETEEERAARKLARKEAKREAKRAREAAMEEGGEGEATEESQQTGKKPRVDEQEKLRKEFYEAHNIVIEGEGCGHFYPIYTFEDAKFPTIVQPVIQGFKKPMPIQSLCWPIIASKRDMIGIAETGSGKTMAFALPSLNYLQSLTSPQQDFRRTPKVLILAPTRELIMQTAEVYTQLGARIACLYGGVSKVPQMETLRGGVDVIAATPGRLIDLAHTSNCCKLAGIQFLVLDEADRMLDIGFERDIRKILAMLNPERQSLFFSATWPSSVQKLAQEFTKKDQIKVTIGSQDLSANIRIKQIIEFSGKPFEKDQRFMKVMNEYYKGRSPSPKSIVFVLYKKDAPKVQEMLSRGGYSVGALHGNSSQNIRTKTLEDFREGRINVLVATDVASRGIDVDDIEYVINYSMPLTIEDYVHRIGRTARAGKHGISHSFFCSYNDRNIGWELARIIKEAGQEVPIQLQGIPRAIKAKDREMTCNISEIKPSAKILFDD